MQEAVPECIGDDSGHHRVACSSRAPQCVLKGLIGDDCPQVLVQREQRRGEERLQQACAYVLHCIVVGMIMGMICALGVAEVNAPRRLLLGQQQRTQGHGVLLGGSLVGGW